MNKFYSKLPIILLILGGILRVSGAGSAAIWFDEANTLYRSGIPFFTLLTERSENSGDIFLELILRPLLAISHSVWMLRLPSILAGLVSLWLVWKLMQWFKFNLLQQCLTSALVAFLPGLLWIGQDARVYGLLACVFLAALWFVLEGRWLGVIATCGLMIYCHSTGPVYAAGILLIALYLHSWKIKTVFISGFLIVLSWTPAIIRIFKYWIIQQPWAPTLTATVLIQSTLQAIWTHASITTWFALLALLTLLLTLGLLFSKIKAHSRIVCLAAWSIPLASLCLFSLFTNNMVQYRTLMPMLFTFCLWLGWELGLMQRPYILRYALAGLWTWLLLVGLWYWNPADRGGGLNKVAAEIRSNWQPGDTLVYTTETVALPFDYYLRELPHTWVAIVDHPFLAVPSIVRTYRDCSIPCRRYWIVIPEDLLITPAEHIDLNTLVHDQKPIYQIRYLQAAPIDVYLVEDK
jgi:hypothetical protein